MNETFFTMSGSSPPTGSAEIRGTPGESAGAICYHHCGDAYDGSHAECRRILRATKVTRVAVRQDHIFLDFDGGSVVLPLTVATNLRDRITRELSEQRTRARRTSRERALMWRSRGEMYLRKLGSH